MVMEKRLPLHKGSIPDGGSVSQPPHHKVAPVRRLMVALGLGTAFCLWKFLSGDVNSLLQRSELTDESRDFELGSQWAVDAFRPKRLTPKAAEKVFL